MCTNSSHCTCWHLVYLNTVLAVSFSVMAGRFFDVWILYLHSLLLCSTKSNLVTLSLGMKFIKLLHCMSTLRTYAWQCVFQKDISLSDEILPSDFFGGDFKKCWLTSPGSFYYWWWVFFFATLPVSRKWHTTCEIVDLSGVGKARYFLSTNMCSYREYSVHG